MGSSHLFETDVIVEEKGLIEGLGGGCNNGKVRYSAGRGHALRFCLRQFVDSSEVTQRDEYDNPVG